MKKVTRFILLKICSVLSIINLILPKNEKNILFFTNISCFNDNNRALFEYMLDNKVNEKFRLYYSTPDYKANKVLNANNNVFYISPFAGILVFLITKYCFYDAGTTKIRPSIHQNVISLWHGTPLKKVGRSVEKSIKNDRYNDFSKIVCTSSNLKSLFAESFECDIKDVIVTGYPRNDNLFDKTNYLNLLNVSIKKHIKKVIWMPTFRVSENGRYRNCDVTFSNNETGLQLFEFDSDLCELDNFLIQKNIFLCIKLHPLSFANTINFKTYENIRIINKKDMQNLNIQNYRLLSNFDSLITDYSSVFFDYLILNRPIGFIIDDIDQYQDNRGFSFNKPLDYMPGPKITKKDDFYNFLINISNNTDCYEEDRLRVMKLVNDFTDNNSSRRLLDFVGISK